MDNSWTEKENIRNAAELIEEFHDTQPDKPGRKSRKTQKKTPTRNLEISMSSFPKELFHPMPPLNDREDVDEELPSMKELLRLVFPNHT